MADKTKKITPEEKLQEEKKLQERINSRESFDRYINSIRKGMLDSGYEKSAKELAKQYGFPIRELEEALPIGYRAKFDMLVSFVREGFLSNEKDARELAKQYGFPLNELEVALEVGKTEEAKRKKAVYGTK